MQIITIILIAVFIEAVVSAIKPIWSKDGERMSVAEIVSIVIGIVVAVACKLNILAFIQNDFLVDAPPFVHYMFYAMTGIALGRGTSFVWDLWNRLRKAAEADVPIGHDIETNIEYAMENDLTPMDVDENGEPDLNMENWSLNQIKTFCRLNGIDTSDCILREDYEAAILNAGRVTNAPPTDGGAN